MFSCIPCIHFREAALNLTSDTKRREKGKSKEKAAEREEEEDCGDGHGGGEEDMTSEWVAEDDDGVRITLVPLPGGGNILKKIGFSQELFNESEAREWWRENNERVMELYNVQQVIVPSRTPQDQDQMASSSSEGKRKEQRESHEIVSNAVDASEPSFRDLQGALEWRRENYERSIAPPSRTPQVQHQMASGSSNAVDPFEPSFSFRGLQEEELVHREAAERVAAEETTEYWPGVFLVLHPLPDGRKDLVRVDLSIKHFGGKVKAKVWWRENGERLLHELLSGSEVSP